MAKRAAATIPDIPETTDRRDEADYILIHRVDERGQMSKCARIEIDQVELMTPDQLRSSWGAGRYIFDYRTSGKPGSVARDDFTIAPDLRAQHPLIAELPPTMPGYAQTPMYAPSHPPAGNGLPPSADLSSTMLTLITTMLGNQSQLQMKMMELMMQRQAQAPASELDHVITLARELAGMQTDNGGGGETNIAELIAGFGELAKILPQQQPAAPMPAAFPQPINQGQQMMNYRQRVRAGLASPPPAHTDAHATLKAAGDIPGTEEFDRRVLAEANTDAGKDPQQMTGAAIAQTIAASLVDLPEDDNQAMFSRAYETVEKLRELIPDQLIVKIGELHTSDVCAQLVPACPALKEHPDYTKMLALAIKALATQIAETMPATEGDDKGIALSQSEAVAVLLAGFGLDRIGALVLAYATDNAFSDESTEDLATAIFGTLREKELTAGREALPEDVLDRIDVYYGLGPVETVRCESIADFLLKRIADAADNPDATAVRTIEEAAPDSDGPNATAADDSSNPDKQSEATDAGDGGGTIDTSPVAG